VNDPCVTARFRKLAARATGVNDRVAAAVAIAGAGMSGLCVAIALLHRGITDVTLYQKADEVGGTWRENTCSRQAAKSRFPRCGPSRRPNTAGCWQTPTPASTTCSGTRLPPEHNSGQNPIPAVSHIWAASLYLRRVMSTEATFDRPV
jgi:cation diffusion facilitator CzcD-associated flavoprotein CzcO